TQRIGSVKTQESLIKARLLKHVATGVPVELDQLLDGQATGEACGDDCAGAGTGNVVEKFAETECLPTAADRGEQLLEAAQNSERDQTADAATVDRKHFSRFDLFVAGAQAAPPFRIEKYRASRHSLRYAFCHSLKKPTIGSHFSGF